MCNNKSQLFVVSDHRDKYLLASIGWELGGRAFLSGLSGPDCTYGIAQGSMKKCPGVTGIMLRNATPG